MNAARILNDSTILNIFTDASLYKTSNTILTCAGAIAVTVYGDTVDYNYLILADSTNNQGEIAAIKLGVGIAEKFSKEYSTINIISDSIISVRGLAEWMGVWYENRKDNTLISSSGKPVANQNIFIEIIHKILSLKIDHLSIYHTLGHMRSDREDHLRQIISVFDTVNKKSITVEDAKYLATFNSLVDTETRIRLNDSVSLNRALYIERKGLIPELPTENDICRYFSIIK